MALLGDPPHGTGVRKATGTQRPAPGIWCWNCSKLTPFPAATCKWCGAAFAGSRGGEFEDQVPDRTVRATVATPASGPRGTPLRRVVRRLSGSTSEDVEATRSPSASVVPSPRTVPSREPPTANPFRAADFFAKATTRSTCPVCGRPALPDALRCQCGAVFGDASTTFNCAECGSVLPVGSDHCYVCGIAFAGDGDALYACSLCGASVGAAATTCRCGAQFAD